MYLIITINCAHPETRGTEKYINNILLKFRTWNASVSLSPSKGPGSSRLSINMLQERKYRERITITFI
jgi:hypothetical protein